MQTNVAVIGLGNMGKNHVRVYFESPQSRLVAVCDRDEKIVQELSQKYNVKGYTDYKEMFEKEDILAVSIVVPTKIHKEIALYASQQKKHILLEKPIALTTQEAEDIISSCKKNDVVLMIGHIERFNPAILELKEKLSNKELSEIYKVEIVRVGPFPPRVVDVGVVIDLTVHDLDIIYYLLQTEIKELASFSQRKLHKKHEDSIAAVIKYDNGMIASLTTNWLSPNKVRELRIYGKEGMFKVNFLTQDLYFYENESITYQQDLFTTVAEGKMFKHKFTKVEPLKKEIESFLSCIVEGTKSPVPGEEGLKALQNAIRLKEESKE